MYPYDPVTAMTVAAMLRDERIAETQTRRSARNAQRRRAPEVSVHRSLSAGLVEVLGAKWRHPSRIEQT